MELFKLFGTIALKGVPEAKKDLQGVTGQASSSGDKMSATFGKIGKAAKVVGGAIAAAFAVDKIVDFGKYCVDMYANYEQLVGGVETLFGAGGKTLEEYADSVGKTVDEVRDEYNRLMKAQQTVMDNASEAYKTAGLSANAYMETVTSFSASLIQSLGGNTEEAAKKANQAIIDMSDNANKMGTDMQSIQNAYQGFAKQNYTMLDNLKLGYGGTQEEMKRLIEDASKMKDVQEKLGVTVDANSTSFGNIVDAISVMQESMGIAGTTSKEASETISGSIASMKSAWDNLVTGFGDENADLDVLFNNWIESVDTAKNNLIPRIGQIIGSIGKVIVEKAPELIAGIPDKLNEKIPKIVEKITTAFGDAFSLQESPFGNLFSDDLKARAEEVATNIKNMATNMGSSVFQTFSDNFGKIKESIETTSPFIKQLGEDYISRLFDQIEQLTGYINSVVVPVFEFLVTAFTDVGTAIWEGIAPYVTEISNKFTELSEFVTEAVNTYILPPIQSFIEMVQELWNENQDKIEKIGTLFGKVFSLIADIIGAGVEAYKKHIQPFFEWFSRIVKSNMGTIKEIFQTAFDMLGHALDFFIALFEGDWEGMWESLQKWANAGRKQLEKIFQLIASVLGSIGDKIKSKISDAFESIKSSMVEKINAAKTKVSSIFLDIFNGIKTKIDDAKTTVKNGLDAIKGFFDKLKLKLPDIKLPHFKLNGEFDLSKGKVPKIDIDWYAKGAVLKQPTLFGINPATGNPMGGGEAGAEAIAPIDVLQNYVRQAVAEGNANDGTQEMIRLLKQQNELLIAMLQKDTSLKIDGREFGRMVNKYA